MNRFKGKRLLHFGVGSPSRDIILYSKQEGAYVICANNDNAFKDLADEVISLDINNIAEVVSYVKDNHIDAISTDATESHIEKGRILNEAIGNKYWHTGKQWQAFMNKANFRRLCIDHNIDCPKTYFMGSIKDLNLSLLFKIKYPVIVKPTDKAGGFGVNVCYNLYYLIKAIYLANNQSKCKEIIIEEYIKGKEVSITYVIQNNKCRLVSIGDKYVRTDSRNRTVVPYAYLYPSIHLHEYLKVNDNKVIEMIKSQALNNCTIFFQSIYTNNKFYIFEAGLRLEGTDAYFHNANCNNQNYFNYLIDYLLKATTNYDIDKDDPHLNNYLNVVYAILLNQGTISSIEGIEDIKKVKDVLYVSQLHEIGEYISCDDQIKRIYGGVTIQSKDKQRIIEVIKEARNKVIIKDENGNNMIDNSFNLNNLYK